MTEDPLAIPAFLRRTPASPEERGRARARAPKGSRRQNMLIPKSRPRPEFVPALPEAALSWLAAGLGPAERRALREIAQAGDLAEVEGKTYLVAPVSLATIDALAAFEAEGEDRESDLYDEPSEDLELDASDQELDEADREPDDPHARQRFIQARRVRVATPEWESPHGYVMVARVEYRQTSRPGGARDYEEGRWVRLLGRALAVGKATRR